MSSLPQGVKFIYGIRRRKGPLGGRSEVQSVIFHQDYWSPVEAKRWLKKHSLKAGKIDYGQDYFRFRQYTPKKYVKHRTSNPGLKWHRGKLREIQNEDATQTLFGGMPEGSLNEEYKKGYKDGYYDAQVEAIEASKRLRENPPAEWHKKKVREALKHYKGVVKDKGFGTPEAYYWAGKADAHYKAAKLTDTGFDYHLEASEIANKEMEEAPLTQKRTYAMGKHSAEAESTEHSENPKKKKENVDKGPWYLGVTHDGKAKKFQSKIAPTARSHGDRFKKVVGPYASISDMMDALNRYSESQLRKLGLKDFWHGEALVPSGNPKTSLDSRAAAFIKKYGTASGGNWTAMAMSAIKVGAPNLWESLEDRSYEFMEIWDILKDYLERHPSKNPPKRGLKKIYGRIQAIEAQKDGDSLWPHENFRHDFKKGGPILGADGEQTVTVPDGSLIIPPSEDGKKLWKDIDYD